MDPNMSHVGVGDLVRLEDNEGYEGTLTLGHIYKVVPNLSWVDDDYAEGISTIHDDGEIRWTYRARWEAMSWNASEDDFEDQEVLSVASEYTNDNIVVRPHHYTQFEVEPITFIMKNGFEFWRGNIIKYAARAGSKIYDNQTVEQSEITDLRKVIRYAEMRINQLQGREVL